jgi:alpha-L-rhamnosidase
LWDVNRLKREHGLKQKILGFCEKFNIMIPEPFKTFIPDELTRRYILPNRIVWQSQGLAHPEYSNRLLDDNSMQASTQDLPGCLLKYNDKPAGILLDFGCELNGGIRITVSKTFDSKPVRLRIRFGESVSEAMGEPNNDHSMQDGIIYVTHLSTSDYGNTGFRFVRIDILDKNTYVEIKQICAVFVFRDLEYKGQFECSDATLNKIWQTGAYTVHLNMQEYLWDGIKRDRLIWLGDMHPEVMTINYVFGNNDIVPRSLDFVCNRSPLPEWMNTIPSYSLWWILVQKDWYLYNGDFEYLKEQKDYLLGLLEQLQSYIGQNSNEILPETRFLDWPTSEDKYALDAGLQSMMILAFKAAAWLCRHLSEFSVQQRCFDAVERLLNCKLAVTHRKQVVAMMTLAGILDAESANKDFLSKKPCCGLSPFLGYYVLQARSLAKDYNGALNVIRDYWGAMLELGATTFWEAFDISWKDSARIDQIVLDGKKDFHGECGEYCYKGLRHSLCHGWSSGPTAWLSEHVLGFRPLAPGSKKLQIKPELADLDWAKGTFPTPYGPVTVSHSKDNHGQVHTIVKKPEDIEIIKNDNTGITGVKTIVS